MKKERDGTSELDDSSWRQGRVRERSPVSSGGTGDPHAGTRVDDGDGVPCPDGGRLMDLAHQARHGHPVDAVAQAVQLLLLQGMNLVL